VHTSAKAATKFLPSQSCANNARISQWQKFLQKLPNPDPDPEDFQKFNGDVLVHGKIFMKI